MFENYLTESVVRWVNFISEFEKDPDCYLSTSESILVGIAFCDKTIIDSRYAQKSMSEIINRLDGSQKIALAYWFASTYEKDYSVTLLG